MISHLYVPFYYDYCCIKIQLVVKVLLEKSWRTLSCNILNMQNVLTDQGVQTNTDFKKSFKNLIYSWWILFTLSYVIIMAMG